MSPPREIRGSYTLRVRDSSVGDPPRLRLEALEVPFELECSGSRAESLAESVRAAWEWCTLEPPYDAPDGGPILQTVTLVLDDDPERIGQDAAASTLRGADLGTLMDRLSPLVTRLAVTERSRDLIMFHACALADAETGATVVLYGPSGTGKTTLARTLGTDFVYLSDETAGVTADLRVVPYLKPLSILATPTDALKEQVSPGRLGLVRPPDLVYRLTALVQLQRVPSHQGQALLEPLTTVEALPELVAQVSYTRTMDRPLHTLADLAGRVGGVRRVVYSEAEQLRPVVRALLDGTS